MTRSEWIALDIGLFLAGAIAMFEYLGGAPWMDAIGPALGFGAIMWIGLACSRG